MAGVNRRSFLAAGVSGVVGLGLGFAGGYLLSPEKQVTRTIEVTRQVGGTTVTQTVTQPPVTLTRTVTARGQEQVLNIAEIAGLSGGIAPYGIPMHNSRLIAIEEINNSGGIVIGDKLYKLNLVFVDGAVTDQALAALERFVEQDKIPFILDGASSRNYYALGPRIKEKHPKALVLSAGGYDPDTTKGIPNFYRSTFDQRDLFLFEAEWFKQIGVNKIATLIDKTHADAILYVEQILPKSGFQVVADERYTTGQTDFVPILQKLKGLSKSFDVLIWHGFEPDHINILKQARSVGLLPPAGEAPKDFIMLSQSLAEPDFGLPLAGGDAGLYEGIYMDQFGTAADLPNSTPRIKYINKIYKNKYPGSPYVAWVSTGYDSVYILVRAMQKAGTTTDVQAVMKALNELTVWDVPELTYNYPPGRLFDSEGQAHPILTLSKWEKGQFKYVTSSWETARFIHDPVMK
jgi:branched-chain amino acid transport system substrate-binding protein